MKNYKFIFYIIIICCCFAGLGIKMGLFAWDFKWYTFLYFTNQSNLLVLTVYIGALFLKLTKENKVYHFFYGLAFINIVITCLIYFFVLAPSMFQMYGGSMNFDHIGNLLLHLVVPILMIIDFLVSKERSKFSYSYIFLWMGFLILYFIFLVVQAKLGGFIPNQNTKYPYGFIAVDLIGWRKVMKNGFFVFITYGCISLMIVKISHLKYIKHRKK